MAELGGQGGQPSPALRDKRVTLIDWGLAHRMGDLAMVGKRFAFLRPGWIEEVVRGIDQLGFSPATVAEFKQRGTIIFLGEQEVTIPSAHIAGSAFTCPDLVSLTSDKALYRAGKDTVRLLIASPQRPNQELKLVLRLNGSQYASYPVQLDQYGVCLRSVAGLPEGEYEASLEGTEAGPGRFEVAEYRLAPLTADLAAQTLEGRALSFTLLLRAFGQPFVGAVEIELQERGQRVGQRQPLTTDAQGRCTGKVELTGAGPYTLNVIAGERTATVALKGSEQERRETLTISELGQVQELSLLPLPGAEVCRGVYVAARGSNTSPFLVSQVIGETVELVAREPVDLLRAVMVAPTTGETAQMQTAEGLAAGAKLTLTVPAPYGLLLVGALIQGKPWEGWCAVIRPSALTLEVAAPAQAKPGERVRLTLRTNRPEKVVPVQVIVKDQRLIAPSDPQVELAARIKAALTTEGGKLSTGAPGASLYSAGYLPPTPPPQPVMAAMPFGGGPGVRPAGIPRPLHHAMRLFAQSASVERERGFAPQAAPDFLGMASFNSPGSTVQSSAVPPPAQAGAAKAELTPIRVEFPEVVHNSIVYVQGEAEIEVKLGDALTIYAVEVFGLDGLHWARAEQQFEAQLPVFGDLTLAPFVFAGDQAQGTLYVGAASGRARVEVQRDGEALPLWLDGRRLAPGEEVSSGAAVRFAAQPGAYTAIVKDAVSGAADVSERFVTPPGQIRSLVKRTRLLTAGETLTRTEAGAISLRVLPGLERPFHVFVQGACSYPHGCIEQSSAKLLAMVTGYIANLETPDKRDEYESSALAYVKRIQIMYLPGRGYTMYPPSEGGRTEPDHHYGPGGTRHQLNLPKPERISGISPAMADGLSEIHRMASDAASVYKIIYPPEQVNDCHDAYLLLANGASAAKKTEAAAYVRSRLQAKNGQTFVEVQPNQRSYMLEGAAVSSREETAYAAAALLVGGEPRDLPLVIKATNYLTSQTNEAGILYSTLDTGAMLVLMIALREAGIGASGGSADMLELNGKQTTLEEALAATEPVESVTCLKGVLTVEATAELVEDWSTFQSALNVEVVLEKDGRPAPRFKVGDALDLVIRVPRWEPCLVAHVCLPDGLARVVGGGQVKRFALDFAEQTELRVPLAAVAPTLLPSEMASAGNGSGAQAKEAPAQHWAVLVRNMFKEEQAGNPGLLEVRILP